MLWVRIKLNKGEDMKKNITNIPIITTIEILILTGLLILTSGCSTLDKSMLLGGALGAGAVGSFGGLATSGYNKNFQAKTVILSSALGGLVGMGIASAIHKQDREAKEKKRFTTYEQIMANPTKTDKPDLIKPRIETRWVEGRVEGDKYIEGHFEYIIVKPTHWRQ